MNNYQKGLVGIAVIVVLIVVAVAAALMSGFGTTQGEVDRAMTECLEILKTGPRYAIEHCTNEARTYRHVDCEMYDMPACDKVDEFWRERVKIK